MENDSLGILGTPFLLSTHSTVSISAVSFSKTKTNSALAGDLNPFNGFHLGGLLPKD